MCSGLPGQKPTKLGCPGPGSYAAGGSGFGNQVQADKQSMPRATVGKAKCSEAKIYFSNRHQRILLGTESPAAGIYPQPPSIGRQVVGR